MVEWLLRALFFGFLVWLGWFLMQPTYVFVIRISRGKPSVRKGRVTRMFQDHVAAVCREGDIIRGWIGGVRQGRRVALRFSRNFSPGLQQMVRNEWVNVD